ncbi:hypothetical protein K440DRAFT_658685 [Wilcoxina mikolae CBS 423.85]|nr:hypothetical protein K440DRAFT_658685 [Wilcoxina mikolae CBS 423.85]
MCLPYEFPVHMTHKARLNNSAPGGVDHAVVSKRAHIESGFEPRRRTASTAQTVIQTGSRCAGLSVCIKSNQFLSASSGIKLDLSKDSGVGSSRYSSVISALSKFGIICDQWRWSVADYSLPRKTTRKCSGSILAPMFQLRNGDARGPNEETHGPSAGLGYGAQYLHQGSIPATP